MPKNVSIMNTSRMNKTTRMEITSRGKVSTKITFCQSFRFPQTVSPYTFLKNFLVLIESIPVITQATTLISTTSVFSLHESLSITPHSSS